MNRLWTSLVVIGSVLALVGCSAGKPEPPEPAETRTQMLSLQDDIVLDPVSAKNEMQVLNMRTQNGAPGVSMRVRDDILKRATKYVLCYCDAGLQQDECTAAEMHDAARVEYTVYDVVNRGTNVVRIDNDRSGDPYLRVYVNPNGAGFEELDDVPSEGCDHEKVTSPRCVGSGMPVEMYGRTSGSVYICKALEDDGRCLPANELRGEHVVRLKHSLNACP